MIGQRISLCCQDVDKDFRIAKSSTKAKSQACARPAKAIFFNNLGGAYETQSRAGIESAVYLTGFACFVLR
jgi:hypothetical protein